MRGLMCHSVEATSACIIADPRSVIVPRRSDRTLVGKNGSLNGLNRYSQLAEWTHRKQLPPEAKYRSSSSALKSSYKTEDEGKKDPFSGYCDPVKQLILGPSSSSNNTFQDIFLTTKISSNLLPGVTSYSIDLETKRVVVMGHVSPDVVLESISKIKRAEFWPN
ncbi:hypothetical protein SAY86_022950 [Trapa natans]|uniref:HMA domain-containing protein n=1 Tax=Trapa natans TaxID=22666 RepID=A0AAN7R8V3_TRANT|nr:hypothetical protein SAY86_022950 [Trapa natans]